MDKLSLWQDFIANRNENQQQFKQTGILVILQNCHVPQPIYGKLLLHEKISKEDFIKYGYVYKDDGKVEREERVYLSPDMVAIRDWAKKWEVEHTFYPKSRSGCFFSCNKDTNVAYMEMHTDKDNVLAAIKDFPHEESTITTENLLQE